MIGPRKFGTWVVRTLVAAGLAAGIFLGSLGAQASDTTDVGLGLAPGAPTTMSDPEWV